MTEIRTMTAAEILGPDLQTDLIKLINDYSRKRPRNLQKRIGPSEVGTPCLRQLACKIVELDRISPEYDSAPSFMGTAIHAEMQKVIEHGHRVGVDHFLSEVAVEVWPGLSGHCDLVDLRAPMTVLDFKFPGDYRLDKYSRGGPSQLYRTQVHLYAKGLRNQGLPIERVAIWFAGRNKTWSGGFFWAEDYDESIVEKAHADFMQAAYWADVMGLETGTPERAEWIPRTPFDDCRYCPWFGGAGATGLACPGTPMDSPPENTNNERVKVK